MLSRSLAEREALGRQAREHSEAGKREQSDALMDVNLPAVEAAMEAAHAALLIHGKSVNLVKAFKSHMKDQKNVSF
jgi:hypothetical protein